MRARVRKETARDFNFPGRFQIGMRARSKRDERKESQRNRRRALFCLVKARRIAFWARQLGVKADANPQVDNVAFVKPTHLQTFEVRCAELCGIWHGEMFDHGRVVTPAEFETWIHQAQVTYAPATKALPPYSTTYQPKPTRRGG